MFSYLSLLFLTCRLTKLSWIWNLSSDPCNNGYGDGVRVNFEDRSHPLSVNLSTGGQLQWISRSFCFDMIMMTSTCFKCPQYCIYHLVQRLFRSSLFVIMYSHYIHSMFLYVLISMAWILYFNCLLTVHGFTPNNKVKFTQHISRVMVAWWLNACQSSCHVSKSTWWLERL